MSDTLTSGVEAGVSPAIPPREKLTKKAITADHPTWCPGCGDFAVLAAFRVARACRVLVSASSRKRTLL